MLRSNASSPSRVRLWAFAALALAWGGVLPARAQAPQLEGPPPPEASALQSPPSLDELLAAAQLDGLAEQLLIDKGLESGLKPDHVSTLGVRLSGLPGAVVALGYSGPARGYLLLFALEESGPRLLHLEQDRLDWGLRSLRDPLRTIDLQRVELVASEPLLRVTGAGHAGTGLFEEEVFRLFRVQEDGFETVFEGAHEISTVTDHGLQARFRYAFEDRGGAALDILERATECRYRSVTLGDGWLTEDCRPWQRRYRYDGRRYQPEPRGRDASEPPAPLAELKGTACRPVLGLLRRARFNAARRWLQAAARRARAPACVGQAELALAEELLVEADDDQSALDWALHRLQLHVEGSSPALAARASQLLAGYHFEQLGDYREAREILERGLQALQRGVGEAGGPTGAASAAEGRALRLALLRAWVRAAATTLHAAAALEGLSSLGPAHWKAEPGRSGAAPGPGAERAGAAKGGTGPASPPAPPPSGSEEPEPGVGASPPPAQRSASDVGVLEAAGGAVDAGTIRDAGPSPAGAPLDLGPAGGSGSSDATAASRRSPDSTASAPAPRPLEEEQARLLRTLARYYLQLYQPLDALEVVGFVARRSQCTPSRVRLQTLGARAALQARRYAALVASFEDLTRDLACLGDLPGAPPALRDLTERGRILLDLERLTAATRAIREKLDPAAQPPLLLSRLLALEQAIRRAW